MGDVHHHRHRREVARDSDHVDHAVFAELHHGAAVGGFGNALVAKQLYTEIVGELFVFAHAGRPPSFGEGAKRVLGDAGLAAEGHVDEPFEMLGPFPRDDEHDELADPLLERALKPQVLSHLLQPVHELRTAQQRYEGAFHPFARTGNHLRGGLALRVGHLAGRQRRHPVVESELSYDPFRFTHVLSPFAAVKWRSGRALKRQGPMPAQIPRSTEPEDLRSPDPESGRARTPKSLPPSARALETPPPSAHPACPPW